MFNYNPLYKTLFEKGLTINDLRDTLLYPNTINSIKKGKSINLNTIDKICQHLKVPIEKVVEIEIVTNEENNGVNG
jgi:DNA-binding Xre family transcriptional regulator